jgi:hypothetical protein
MNIFDLKIGQGFKISENIDSMYAYMGYVIDKDDNSITVRFFWKDSDSEIRLIENFQRNNLKNYILMSDEETILLKLNP